MIYCKPSLPNWLNAGLFTVLFASGEEDAQIRQQRCVDCSNSIPTCVVLHCGRNAGQWEAGSADPASQLKAKFLQRATGGEMRKHQTTGDGEREGYEKRERAGGRERERVNNNLFCRTDYRCNDSFGPYN